MARTDTEYLIEIISVGVGGHSFRIVADDPSDAVQMAKEQAKVDHPFAHYHTLSGMWRNVPVNGRGELITSN